MSDERERLVRAVEEAHHIEDKVFAVYDEVSDKTIEAEAALAAYDAAHNTPKADPKRLGLPPLSHQERGA